MSAQRWGDAGCYFMLTAVGGIPMLILSWGILGFIEFLVTGNASWMIAIRDTWTDNVSPESTIRFWFFFSAVFAIGCAWGPTVYKYLSEKEAHDCNTVMCTKKTKTSNKILTVDEILENKRY